MLQPKKSFIEVPRTARYFQLGNISSNTKNVWIVFHGYGQLAEYFVKHFEEINQDENVVIAVEGLSRFYVEGLTGRVGASWMTKDDRELEIKDQSNYINAVLNDAGVDTKSDSYNLIVLGFSQGTSTAIRWFSSNAIRPSRLILWAGSFPHDINPLEYDRIFNGLPVDYVYGKEDQFLQNVNMDEKMKALNATGMNVSVWTFDGKHVMDKPTLAKIVDSFAS